MSTPYACVLSIAALVLAGLPARAEDAPYVGTWSLELGNCAAAQDTANAPLVITKERLDQHETHCTFKSVEGNEGDYKVAGDCTVEGKTEPATFTLTVSGDTLTFTDSAGARDLLRCK
jgi:hypothetical protein